MQKTESTMLALVNHITKTEPKDETESTHAVLEVVQELREVKKECASFPKPMELTPKADWYKSKEPVGGGIGPTWTVIRESLIVYAVGRTLYLANPKENGEAVAATTRQKQSTYTVTHTTTTITNHGMDFAFEEVGRTKIYVLRMSTQSGARLLANYFQYIGFPIVPVSANNWQYFLDG